MGADSELHQEIITLVESKLGEPLREDGPILGMEFDPLLLGAFGAPTVSNVKVGGGGGRSTVSMGGPSLTSQFIPIPVCLGGKLRNPKKGETSHTGKKPKLDHDAGAYGECSRNHAVEIGEYVLDGCLEFMAGGEEGTIASLQCAACNCHRRFHRYIAPAPL